MLNNNQYQNIINNKIDLGIEYTPDVKVYNIICDLSKNVEINNNVDTSKLGKYDINGF